MDTARLSGWPVIAVNSTWRMAPDCDVIYAGDLEWWATYHAQIDSAAERWTCHAVAARRYNVKLHAACGAYNSGMRAIQFAAERGARCIVLLGFDCGIDDGTHWHGAHPAGLRNPTSQSPARWQGHFSALAPQLVGIDVINCSRATQLTQFRRLALDEALLLPFGGRS
uniref:Norphogenetic protein n=1 Tax=Serratia marcescens TaxID=615 RepID=A0A9X8VMG9_SERMA